MAVPPGEVEQVLLCHPAVAEVIVAGVPDRRWGEIVGAAVLLTAPLAAPATSLARYCRPLLAAYKVPERWLFTSALPRGQDGDACRERVRAQLAVMPRPAGPELLAVGPIDFFRPRPAIEDLRIPRQTRRSWALEDL